MNRVVIAAALSAVVVLAAAAAATGAGRASPTKLTVWVGWSAGKELITFKKVAAEYDKAHPEVTLDVVGGDTDQKIVAAIRSGNAPDVVSSFNSYNVGVYCGTKAWLDLAPFMAKSHISASLFPKATQYYTQYGGVRCALPLLADTYGLYYNTALFKKAHLTHPPRTISELTAYAKKLTVRNKDGSLKVVGLDPLIGFYENVPERWAQAFGAKYIDAKGHAILSKQPAWQKMMKWQKELIDWYGYKNLVKFQTGLGDEFSSSNGFQTGKLAMNMDGEWRVAFIQNEVPNLPYATAPLPVDDSHPELYGSGYINGTIIGIPKNGHHTDQAWELVKYLTTNTHALAELANGLRNVPSTPASTKSKELIPDKNFATFLKIFNNTKSGTSPIMASGQSYTNLVQTTWQNWQAGSGKNLGPLLQNLDKQLDAQVKQAGGGGGGGVP
jgi:ABC-type glycerol-3-phosphate transport system substrate-binding protein